MNFFTLTKLGRTLLLVAALAVGALCLSGCGGNGKESGSENPIQVLSSFESAYLIAGLEADGKVVSKDDLIFEAPISSEYFTYEISEDLMSCMAKAKGNMFTKDAEGKMKFKLKKGDYFLTTYNENDGSFIHSSNNDAARNIYPNFFKR
jgi:hypothetical protein